GFEIQMPLIARLRDEHKIRVETMETSGRWFKKQYKVTPATSFTVSHDLGESDLKTVWFNSRFYRVNLLWENGNLRIRDLHLFDESFPSVYTKQVATSNECTFFTLPVIDGYIWSKPDQIAGLRLKALINGNEVLLTGKDPVFTHPTPQSLHISWPLISVKGAFEIDLNEKQLAMKLLSKQVDNWYFDMTTAAGVKLPFEAIQDKQINCSFEGTQYIFKATKGTFSEPGNGTVFRLKPQANAIAFDLSSIKRN
ncbi:MAG: hypothetical protein JWQ57_704, partial [Mucilaginibacter sp.]|nr:hypothetical protein [Mucilaginibacter sp.]